MKKIFLVFTVAWLVLFSFCPLQASEAFLGETFVFNIKKIGIKAGEAKLTFKGKTQVDGEDVFLIVFRAKGFNFFDEERIYVDTEEYYPIRVERKLNIFGKKERIVERYDQANGRVTVEKISPKEEPFVIERQGKIDNIYGFIYRCREQKRITDKALKLNLPTQDVKLFFVKEMMFGALGKKMPAYYFRSGSKNVEIWFDQSTKRLPLRIDGALAFGDTAMILKKYSLKEQ